MKVVIFCGGLGMRLRDQLPNTPKPLARIGYRPILWHLMNYYAHFGHNDFILCLGYRADAIKEYFVRYDETVSNDFVLSGKNGKVEVAGPGIADWTIRFVDTGLNSNIGMRLRAVREHLEGEEMFLANYADGLSDLDLEGYVKDFKASGKIARFLSVKPNAAFHMVDADPSGLVRSMSSMAESDIRINGGFFAFRNEIFDYLEPGDELVLEAFNRLMEREELVAHRYDGFWQCMDTFKDKQSLEELAERDDAPWQVWRSR